MSKIERYRDPSDRRKAKWELHLNPFVTMLILTFCIGILLVWIGLFENRVTPDDPTVTPAVNGFIASIKDWFASLR